MDVRAEALHLRQCPERGQLLAGFVPIDRHAGQRELVGEFALKQAESFSLFSHARAKAVDADERTRQVFQRRVVHGRGNAAAELVCHRIMDCRNDPAKSI
jgi:hypothetical protein